MFEIIRKFFKDKDRDLDLGTIYNFLQDTLWNLEDEEGEFRFSYPVVLDILQNDNETYAVFSDGGKLFKATYRVSGGRDVEINDIQQVVVNYEPVEERSTLVLRRNENNDLLFIAIAGSAVLNRSGELDSTDLFDSLEDTFDPNNKPFITFRHIGESIKFGEIDGVMRLETLLMVYGTIDESTPLGAIFEERYNEDPEKWGISIGFMPEDSEVMRLTENVDVKVYTSGVLREVSVLKESEAAHYFTKIFPTTVKELNRMGKNRDQALSALKEFVGDAMDDKQIDELLDEAQLRIDRIKNEKLITRDADTDVEEVEVEEEAEEATLEIDINEEVFSKLVSDAKDAVLQEINPRFEEVGRMTGEINSRLEEFINRLDQFQTVSEERMTKLERTDEEKVSEASQDRPTAQISKVKVGYRASDSVERVSDENGAPKPKTASEQASRFFSES